MKEGNGICRFIVCIVLIFIESTKILKEMKFVQLPSENDRTLNINYILGLTLILGALILLYPSLPKQ